MASMVIWPIGIVLSVAVLVVVAAMQQFYLHTAIAAIVGGVLLALTRFLPSSDPLFSFPGIVPELIALLVAIPLGLVAVQVLTARDARRFVLGFVGVAAAWFVFLYPNISALPLPATLVNAYQGILPTYIYAFQFGVNTVERGATVFQDVRFAILMGFLVIACGVVAWSARMWRLAAAEDAARDRGGSAGGPAGEPGSA